MSGRAGVAVASPRVAFQGERGAFGYEAVRARFGAGALDLPQRSFDDVVAVVLTGEADFGVLPVENSIVGAIAPARAALAGAGLAVIGEVVRPIRHCLLAAPGATLEGIRQVLSHPAALGQCGRFLGAHPGLEPVEAYDTAGAAAEVARRGDSTLAAIAAAAAGSRYGLAVLAAGIQDCADNRTRFVVVARAAVAGG